MNHSISMRLVLGCFVVSLSFTLSISGQAAAAEPGQQSTSSQGTSALAPAAPGQPLDNQPLTPAASASFYHVAASTLIPTDSAAQLAYDYMGCIHATAGAFELLNAPLNIPNGSRIVLLRLYYDDTSASDITSWLTRYNEPGTNYEDLVSASSTGTSGHGSSYGNLDHVVDTYNWSYVLNVRMNSASSTLQVCGLRVMYYPPLFPAAALPQIRK